MLPVASLYHRYVYHNPSSELKDFAQNIWGKIPLTYGEAVEIGKTMDISGFSDLSELQQFLINFHKEHGIYTEKVGENIAKIGNGVILTGQQPSVLGGSSLVGNKIACASSLSDMSDKEFPVVYYFADYDGSQRELLKGYLPNAQSEKAHIVEFPYSEENIAVHSINIASDSEGWLGQELEKIRLNYSEFSSKLDKTSQRKLLEERLDHIFSIITSKYSESNNFSVPVLKIWGFLVNHVADLGIIFLPSSHPFIRKRVLNGYKAIMSGLTLFVNTINDVKSSLQEKGFKSGMGARSEEYLPFYYECADGSRVELKGILNGDSVIGDGICSLCKSSFSLDFGSGPSYPGLDAYAEHLSPRVDSSQITIQSLLPIRIRVSGPGEIGYFAQVYSAAKAIGIDLPIFVMYTRLFYNSPWIEELGKDMKSSEDTSYVLPQKHFFQLLGALAKARRKNQTQDLPDIVHNITNYVEHQYKELLTDEETIQVQQYLSWQFGVFSPNHYGQEVSWLWIDLAIQTGIYDYLETYKRYYHHSIPIAGIGYLNTLTL